MRFARKTTASRLGTTAAVLIAALLAGCASGSSGPAKKKPAPSHSDIPDPGPDNPGQPTATISGKDPCADRLHALCGPLLLHYAVKRHLPAHIDELRAFAGGDPAVEFTCPVSGKPYVYEPRG